MESLFKKTKVNLELLTDIDMLLMVEKGLRGGICQATYRYAKACDVIWSGVVDITTAQLHL